MRRLLFLNGIKAFEAAARSGSFAGAGAELNVSAAAVSRMVHLLEQRLGVALFERKANRLAMTTAGRAYQSGLTPIFDALASLTAQVTAPSGVRVLTIGVGPTFAMRWLIPRLAGFRKEEPNIDVRITTGGAAAQFSDDWSCGIQLGSGEWPGLIAEPLFAADLLPVCVPRLASGLKQPGIAHLVLERHRIAERWRSERWDGLKFQFPNWSVKLPDFPFPQDQPDAFATASEIVQFIDAFAKFVAPPIRCGVAVTRLAR